VQDEIRYLGIETGENSHRPHDPETVFAQRYGDCKDKAYLLCAMLRANDIACDPVLVNTYKRARLNDFLPSPADFNHVVVRIHPEDKRFIFVDATYALQGGTASTTFFPYYGEGLLLKKGQTATMPMPYQNMGLVDITEEIFLNPLRDTSGRSQVMVKTVYHGSQADDMRSDFQGRNLSDMEEEYLNYYRDVFRNVQVEPSDSIEYYDSREANNLSVVERYSLQNPWVYDSTRKSYYFYVLGKILYNQVIMLPDRKREEPVSLPFPYAMNYTLRVHFDRYNQITKDAWSVKRGSYTIRFQSEVNEQEKAWDLHYEYKILKDHVPLSEVTQFKDDIKRLVKSLDYEIRDMGDTGGGFENLNYWMIFVVLLSFVLAVLLFRKLNRYSPGSIFGTGSGIALGGWLHLIAFTLVLQPFFILSSLASDYPVYLTDSGWASLNGQSELKIQFFHALLVGEAVVNVFMFYGSVFLLYIFFNKRDSFPRIFTIYFLAKVMVLLVDTGISVVLFDSDMSSDSLAEIGNLSLYCVIWISYMNRSARVEKTFVKTYRGKGSTETNSKEILSEEVAG
jgi:hypothetical protein